MEKIRVVVGSVIMNNTENTLYIINGKVQHIYQELLDISGPMVYTNFYKGYITRIINTCDTLTVFFPSIDNYKNDQYGYIPNDALHYIENNYYFLIDGELRRCFPNGPRWNTYPENVFVSDRAIEKAELS